MAARVSNQHHRRLSLAIGVRQLRWTDWLVLAGVVGLVFFVVRLAEEWTGPLRPTVQIDLSPRALPYYALLSLSRGLIAYVFSLAFTIVYGYWAAKDVLAERVLIPMLDILQSIPVLGFMPGLILALVALFPHSNFGLELAAVLMIFTGQVWNMTFSFYQSLRSVPENLNEVGGVYGFSWWMRFRYIELPYATVPLVWNSMMSMAGGWFFLMVSEAFVLGGGDFRLPGIGSYMSVAVERGNVSAMIWAILAMTAMIVLLDQLLWRPVVAWSQKFRVEESRHEEVPSSWVLDWLRRSRLRRLLTRAWARWGLAPLSAIRRRRASRLGGRLPVHVRKATSRVVFGGLMLILAFGGWKLVALLSAVPLHEWTVLVRDGLRTLLRVLAAVAIGTLWTVPAGLAIGLSPRLSRVMQPVVQVAASFPAPMLFPIVIVALSRVGVGLGLGSVLLMLLGTQWYILFNVIAGAMTIPADLKEAATSFRWRVRQRFWGLYIPAIFPYLVTGWITAAGGAWNASIVSEYVSFKGQTLVTAGLGASVSLAAAEARFPLLAASVVVMSTTVVLFNRLIWRRLQATAEQKFALNR